MSHRRPAIPALPGPSGGRILLRFAHPEPPKTAHPGRPGVLPVFLPFAGCPQRCIFCDQAAQTGQAPEPLEAIFARLGARLCATAQAPAQELAFYGGTFTALPAPWPRRFVELAGRFLASGRISRIRCSTRPDAVDAGQLAELKALGLSLVELGVQSFDDAALSASRRGYDKAAALTACETVRTAGLGLGIQLMPGLPSGSSLSGLSGLSNLSGLSDLFSAAESQAESRAGRLARSQAPETFLADVALAASLGPELARLYPCLVLEGTPLAALWRAGTYAPWALDETVEALAQALLILWGASIPTARMGLVEQEGLAILAGPRHPALGQMARSRALLLFVQRKLAELPAPAQFLHLPRRLQGEALGQKNALEREYADLGLSLRLWDQDDLALCAGGRGAEQG